MGEEAKRGWATKMKSLLSMQQLSMQQESDSDGTLSPPSSAGSSENEQGGAESPNSEFGSLFSNSHEAKEALQAKVNKLLPQSMSNF